MKKFINNSSLKILFLFSLINLHGSPQIASLFMDATKIESYSPISYEQIKFFSPLIIGAIVLYITEMVKEYQNSTPTPTMPTEIDLINNDSNTLPTILTPHVLYQLKQTQEIIKNYESYKNDKTMNLIIMLQNSGYNTDYVFPFSAFFQELMSTDKLLSNTLRQLEKYKKNILVNSPDWIIAQNYISQIVVCRFNLQDFTSFLTTTSVYQEEKNAKEGK